MSSFANVLFILQFCGFFFIVFLKLWNILHKAEKLSIQWIWLTFIGGFLFFLLGLVTFLTFPEILFSVLFRLQSWFLIVFIFLFLFEIFFMIKSSAEKPIEAYKSTNNRR